MQDIHSISIGFEALRFVNMNAQWELLTCFNRSLYLKNPTDQIVCLVHSTLGPGPLNILVDIDLPHGGFANLITAPACVSSVTESGGLSLKISGLGTLKLSNAAIWKPEPFPVFKDDQLMRGVEIALAALPFVAPSNALIGIFLDESKIQATAVDKILLNKVNVARDHLSKWLQSALQIPGKVPPPQELKSLIGLGVGLTPSGDDFLCGALITLHALGYPDLAKMLARDFLPGAERKTNTVSLAHLRCAAMGFGGATIHNILNCLLRGGRGLSLNALSNIGHTSGWDAFAGAMTVINSYLRNTYQTDMEDYLRWDVTKKSRADVSSPFELMKWNDKHSINCRTIQGKVSPQL